MVAEMRRMAWAFEWLYSVADPKNCSIERLAKLMRTARACGFVNWFDIRLTHPPSLRGHQ